MSMGFKVFPLLYLKNIHKSNLLQSMSLFAILEGSCCFLLKKGRHMYSLKNTSLYSISDLAISTPFLKVSAFISLSSSRWPWRHA